MTGTRALLLTLLLAAGVALAEEAQAPLPFATGLGSGPVAVELDGKAPT